MSKINIEDVIQVSIGTLVLAIPLALTDEVRQLSETLPKLNLILIILTSFLLNSCFIFYGVYEGNIKNKKSQFTKRIFINYSITIFVVFYIMFMLNLYHMPILTLINKILIISLPASLGGAVIDSFDKE